MPVKNVILIEKVAQILTIGLALGIKTIIITQLLHLIRNKKERKGEGKDQLKSKNFQRYELVKG